MKLTIFKPAVYILAERTPQAEELNIVRLDKTQRREIFQLVILEGQGAKMVNLRIDLIAHFLREDYILIAALEQIDTVQISVLMEHNLIHIKLIEVGVKQGHNTRGQLHHILYLPFIFYIYYNIFL
jgi:hypothetical protein